MKDDILNPGILVRTRGEDVEVKELTWPNYVRAIKELSGSLLKMVGPGGGAINLTTDSVVEALTTQEQLVGWVLAKATGKPPEWISSLSAREMLPLLQAVVDLNLSQEVVGAGKQLAGAVRGVLGLKTKLPGPLTTSSAPATASPT